MEASFLNKKNTVTKNLFMKKQIIIFIFCYTSLYCQLYSQSNPHRFIASVSICPVDGNILSSMGITATSLSTLTVITRTKTIGANEAVPLNAKYISANIFEVTDTVFTYSIRAKKGMAFEVTGTIGSFTLIELWPYGKENDSDITEYQLASVRSGALTTPSIPVTIKGRRTITSSELPRLHAALVSGVNANSVVDPTKDVYLIRTADLLANTEEFEYKQGAWNVGLMYLPVKIRPFGIKSGVFDFATDISVGTSFSWTMHHNFKNDWTANLLVYTGVSSVKVDSLIAGDPTMDAKSGTQNFTAFSPAIGVYWEKKNIQLGFLIGMDFLAGKLQQTWAYRGMPWFSLTAGINLFKLTENTSEKKGKN